MSASWGIHVNAGIFVPLDSGAPVSGRHAADALCYAAICYDPSAGGHRFAVLCAGFGVSLVSKGPL